MADNDRELLLRIKADIADAEAKLSALRAQEQQLTDQTAALGAGTALTADQLEDLARGAGLSAEQLAALSQGAGLSKSQLAGLNEALVDTEGLTEASAGNLGSLEEALGGAATKTDDLGTATEGATDAVEELSPKLDDARNAALGAASSNKILSAATDDVQSKQVKAIDAFARWAAAAGSGGKKAALAFDDAKIAVAGLEAAIANAQKLGAPVDPKAEAQLKLFDAALQKSVKSTDSQASSSRQLHAIMNLAQSVFGPTARGLADIAKEGDGMAATLSKAALVIGAVVTAASFLNAAFKGMADRGGDVKTLGDLGTEAMDKLAAAFGIASKASADMQKSFEKTMKTLEGLPTTAQSFVTAADMMSASGLEADTIFRQWASTVQQSDITLKDMAKSMDEGLGTALPHVMSLAKDFNDEIRRIREWDPTMARQLTEEFLELARSEQLGSEQAKMLFENTKGLSDEAGEFAQLLKDSLGKEIKDVTAVYGAWSASTQSLEARFNALTTAGFTEVQAFDALRAEIEKNVLAGRDFQKIVEALPPSMQAMIEHLRQLAREHGGVEQAIQKHTDKLKEQASQFNALDVAIDLSTAKYGNHKVAIISVLPEIDKLIESLEQTRDRNGELAANEQAMIERLQEWRAQVKETIPEWQKLIDMEEKGAKSIADQVSSIEQLTRSYVDNVTKIESHRKASVQAADDELRARRNSSSQQIIELNNQYNAHQLTQEEYGRRLAEIQTQEVEDRRAAEDKVKVINEDARVDLTKVVTAYQDKSDALIAALAKEGLSLVEAKRVQVVYQNSLGTLIEQVNKTALAHGGSTRGADSFRESLVKVAGVGIPNVITSLDRLIAKLGETEGKLNSVGSAAGRVFNVNNVGGPTTYEGAEGGPATPENPVGGG